MLFSYAKLYGYTHLGFCVGKGLTNATNLTMKGSFSLIKFIIITNEWGKCQRSNQSSVVEQWQ